MSKQTDIYRQQLLGLMQLAQQGGRAFGPQYYQSGLGQQHGQGLGAALNGALSGQQLAAQQLAALRSQQQAWQHFMDLYTKRDEKLEDALKELGVVEDEE